MFWREASSIQQNTHGTAVSSSPLWKDGEAAPSFRHFSCQSHRDSYSCLSWINICVGVAGLRGNCVLTQAECLYLLEKPRTLSGVSTPVIPQSQSLQFWWWGNKFHWSLWQYHAHPHMSLAMHMFYIFFTWPHVSLSFEVRFYYLREVMDHSRIFDVPSRFQHF